MSMHLKLFSTKNIKKSKSFHKFEKLFMNLEKRKENIKPWCAEVKRITRSQKVLEVSQNHGEPVADYINRKRITSLWRPIGRPAVRNR